MDSGLRPGETKDNRKPQRAKKKKGQSTEAGVTLCPNFGPMRRQSMSTTLQFRRESSAPKKTFFIYGQQL
jgi:hypothetical protein